ncbi:MAG: sialate:H+ symport family MFS transporter [Bifidobacteriaceae bacterium]|jgi:SHS family sialic acid transporter-like MFS transporter|nr:sialate:H+ symport family MFS transporter [Bifidobacteriaceae bacterium]MCI1914724.1 sialate:H+ symport family MFS transporter [Bifidobacteriaceae bacterium]
MVTSTTKIPWYKEISGEKWKAFFASWIGVLLDGYDFVLISLVLGEIIETFHLSLVEGASLVSAAFISRWIGGLVLGAMADRLGRKPAMISSIFLFAGGSILCAFAPSYIVLFIARLIVGFAMAGEYSASSTYIIELWPVNMRNRASGFMLSGYAVGSILAAQIYKYLVPWVDSWHQDWGWRALFLTGIVPILVAVYMRRRLPEADDWKETAAKKDMHELNMLTVLYKGKYRVLNYILTIIAIVLLLLIFTSTITGIALVTIAGVICLAIFSWFVILADRKRWAVGIAVMITVFASFMYTWPILGLLPTYLKTDLGMNAGLVAAIVSFANLGNAFGYILAGFMGDKFGMRKWYTISLILSQILVFPVFMIGGKQTMLLGAMLFFQQMFGQGISGLAPKWVSSYFPVEKRAAGLGFCYNVGALGGAVGPVIGAAAAAAWPLGLTLATVSVGFALIVILSVGLNLPRKIQHAIDASAVRPEDGMDETEVIALHTHKA